MMLNCKRFAHHTSYRLQNDLKYVEWDVKPYYTHTLSLSDFGIVITIFLFNLISIETFIMS